MHFALTLWKFCTIHFFFNYKGLCGTRKQQLARCSPIYINYIVYIYNTQLILSRARGIELKPSKSSRTVYNLFRNTQRRIHSAVFFIHIHADSEETGEGPTHRPGHMAHTTPGSDDWNGSRRQIEHGNAIYTPKYTLTPSRLGWK